MASYNSAQFSPIRSSSPANMTADSSASIPANYTMTVHSTNSSDTPSPDKAPCYVDKESNVWTAFVAQSDPTKHKCRLCAEKNIDKIITCKMGTTNVWNHLKGIHKSEWAELKNQPQEHSTSAEIDSLILDLIVVDLHSIRSVEGQALKKLISKAWLDYKMPSRSTFTSRLEVLHVLEKEKLKKLLSQVPYVAITSDGWKSQQTCENFTTTTAHFIDPTTSTIMSHVLETRPFGNLSHSGENIAHHIRSTLEEFAIQDKVVAIVTDSAANQLKANRELGLDSIRCSAHTTQLAIRDALAEKASPEVAAILKHCESIVTTFKRSAPALSKLKETVDRLGLKQLKVIQNVSNFDIP